MMTRHASPRPVTQAPIATPAAVPDVRPEYLIVAEEFLRAKDAMDAWEAYKKKTAARLSELHRDGKCPTKIEINGYNIALQNGRETDSFDDEGKEQLNRLRDELFAAGHGETKTGDPYWVPRKAAKAKEPKTRRSGVVTQ
jgi:hypothetical protein